jgi:hypothetical protein
MNITWSFQEPATKLCYFTSVIPSQIHRFKFAVSWLCDDCIAVETFVVEVLSNVLRQPPLRIVAGQQFPKIEAILTAFRELVRDLRMGAAISRWNRYTCSAFHFTVLPRCGFLSGNGAPRLNFFQVKLLTTNNAF